MQTFIGDIIAGTIMLGLIGFFGFVAMQISRDR